MIGKMIPEAEVK